MNFTLKSSFFTIMLVGLSFAQTIMYIDPPRIPPKAIDSTFTVKVRLRNAAGICAWQVGFSFNPNVLEGVSVTQDSFLKDAYGLSHPTIWPDPIFDNINGFLFAGCTQVGTDSGGVGDGALMKLAFRVKGTGSSALDLLYYYNTNESYLLDWNTTYIYDEIPFLIQDGFYGDETVSSTPSFCY